MIIGNADTTSPKSCILCFINSLALISQTCLAKKKRTPTHFEPLTGIGTAGTEGIVAPALETWINCLRPKTWGHRPPGGETAGVTLVACMKDSFVASVVVGLNIFKYLHSQLPCWFTRLWVIEFQHQPSFQIHTSWNVSPHPSVREFIGFLSKALWLRRSQLISVLSLCFASPGLLCALEWTFNVFLLSHLTTG